MRGDMSITSAVEAHLPYVRRFARALSGDQAIGDRLVDAVLRRILEDPSIIERAGDRPRLALYRLLLTSRPPRAARPAAAPRRTGALGGPGRGEDPHEQAADEHAQNGAQGGEVRLARLAPASRQAFLLQTLEGFSPAEIAETMDLSSGEVERLLRAAAQEIGEQLRTEVLIIEDEPVIALDLETLIEDAGHRVSGIASTHREALEVADAHAPGLVLADIQLADRSSGIEAVNELLLHLSVPVIFVTAYPERLLSGLRPEPAFVVTKPYSAETLVALISQALFFQTTARRNPAAVA